jgi:N-acetylglucosaminyldiphosphoundecaprenol N-acetyl-beta-D-mannosaminyltransferase
MKFNKIYILGVRIDLLTISQINGIIIDQASKPYRRPLVVFKPYVEFLSLASYNVDIKNLINSSDINVADSTAVAWSASYLYGQPAGRSGIISLFGSLALRLQSRSWLTQIVPEQMAGVDQTIPLLKQANKLKLKVGILGGPRNTTELSGAISSQYKDIDLECWSGYYHQSDEAELVSQIASRQLDILFCALGFPKQEKFALKHKNKLKAKVIIGEGGSFDYDQLGGTIKRAPRLLRRLRLEWLWRLALNPRRFRRQLAIPNFIRKVYLDKRRTK